MAADQAGMKRFYTLFAAMAVVGLGLLGVPAQPGPPR